MRRTQLYLDDDLWTFLHARARSEGTTVSDLVRQAVRQRYLGDQGQRQKAMQAFVGIWKGRFGEVEAEQLVRDLRRGKRVDRLAEE